MLTGDRHAAGLSAVLRQLCDDRSVELRVKPLQVDETTESAANDSLAKALKGVVADAVGFGADVTLVSLGWPAAMSSDALQVRVAHLVELRRMGRSVAWIRPPHDGGSVLRLTLDRARVPSFHSEALDLPMGPDDKTPTAAGYAGWAGAIWRWLR